MGQRVLVGTDITAVPDVLASMTRFGDRYLGRLFTEHELASCPGPPEVAAAGLAARFAAKEAVVKVLRPTGARPTWRQRHARYPRCIRAAFFDQAQGLRTVLSVVSAQMFRESGCANGLGSLTPTKKGKGSFSMICARPLCLLCGFYA